MVTYLPDLFEFVIVLQKERQVLVGDVNVAVSSLLLVLLHSGAASRESVLVDLEIAIKPLHDDHGCR